MAWATNGVSGDRESQRPLIVAEVLRYQLEELSAETADGMGSNVCVAIREDGRMDDPSQRIMALLGSRARPRSSCDAGKSVTVIAGPVEWVRDDEVRVKAGYVRGEGGERPLAYRVVREGDRWKCAGRIMAYDPL